MAESIIVANEQEKLVALQALETYRALQQAVKTAPHGKGLATVEAVVHDKGFDHLRCTNQRFRIILKRKKRGLLFDLPLRKKVLFPLCHAQASAYDGRRHSDSQALLRMPGMPCQTDAVG